MEDMLFSEYLVFYLTIKRKYLKDSSYGVCSNIIYRHLIPYFNDVKLSELTNVHLQDYVVYLVNFGRLDKNGGLSIKTSKDIIIVLQSAIKYAFSIGYLKPFDVSVKYPNTVLKNKEKVFSDEEINTLISFLENKSDPREIGILLTVFTGIRIGELCALKWSDIDLVNRTVTISKTLQRVNIVEDTHVVSKITIDNPKSSKSNRNIPISDRLFKILKSKIGVGYVLTNSDSFIEPRSLRYKYKTVLEKCGVNYLPFHCLRHTFATRLISNTNDYKTVSELLGHSSVSITLDIYMHTSKEKLFDCINSY